MTDEALRERLERAISIVTAAKTPTDLRERAFDHVVGWLGSADGADEVSQAPSVDSSTESNGRLGVLAATFNVDASELARIYEEIDGDLRLIVKSSMLSNPSKKAVAAREVALLLVCGRQAAGVEEWTTVQRVRDECQDLGVLDPKNFSTGLGKLEFKTRGARGSREVRATRNQYEDAVAIVRQINDRL